MKNYYNEKGEQLYVLHFPGTGMRIGHRICMEQLKRKISISESLSVISVQDRKCYECSYIAKQAEFNNFKIYNSALGVKIWHNVNKIGYILECLEMIDTPYALIIDGRDTIFTGDLDDKFINKYLTFGSPIVYNGTPRPYPATAIEDLRDLLKISGKMKYLNAGVCIGETQALKEFYEAAAKINEEYPDNPYEQFVVRMARKQRPDLANIDTESKIFRIVHQYDTSVKEINYEKAIII